MEKENPVQLWDGNSDDVPLRQPKANVPIEAGQRDSRDAKLPELHPSDVTRKKSDLRPEAAEWFPPNFQTAHLPGFSVQERLKRPKGQFEPSADKTDASINNQQTAKQDIDRLQNIIGTLTFDPGQYDNLLHVFIETFMPHFENIEVINLMADILFNHVRNCTIKITFV